VRILISPGFSEGHALPALALARALIARGHEVTIELSDRWREPVAAVGAAFTPSEEYVPFPDAWPQTSEPTVVDRARALLPVLAELEPAVVVADFASPAPALAAELAKVPLATVVPTIYPVQDPGLPPLLTGIAPPRTALGGAFWRAANPALRRVRRSARWTSRVPSLLDRSRAELGLGPLGPDPGPLTTYGPLRGGLVMVTTFPQLEYPRRWPEQVHVTGPAPYELPHPPTELPGGNAPLVLIAPSTVPAPRRELIRLSLEALADEPVRVLATLNRRGEAWSGAVPANARVVDWVSYTQAMDGAAAVVASGGMGTVARSLVAGAPLLVCPTGADTAENGARVSWSGAGLAIPTALQSPASIRLAVRRLVEEPRFAARAAELRRWHAEHDGPTRAAELLERYSESSP